MSFVKIDPIPEPQKRALSFADLAKLIAGAGDYLRPFVVLASFGLGEGEALGICLCRAQS